MAKINISTILDSKENGIISYNGSGILDNKRIVFYEDNIRVTIKFGKDFLELKRSSDQYSIYLMFQNTLTNEGIYDIKCDSMQIPIKVTTNVLNIKDGIFHVEYDLSLGGVNQGNFVYDVKYEVIQ